MQEQFIINSELTEQIPLELDYELVFWIFIGINLTFFAIAKTSNQNYFKSLFTTAIINRQLNQNVQEDLKLSSTSSILLTLTYFTSLALLISHLAFGEHSIGALFLFSVLLGASLLKWAVIMSISFLTQTKNGILEHIYNHFIFFQIGGILLTFILFATHFFSTTWQEYISIGLAIIIGLLVLIREAQSLLRALKARVPVLYIILYLCTLELLPLVVLIYGLTNNFKGLN